MDDESSEVTQTIDVREFLAEWASFLVETDTSKDQSITHSAYLSRELSLESSVIEELDTVCGPSTLNSPSEPQDVQRLLTEIPEDLPLVAPGLQTEELKKRKKYAEYRRKISNKMKYKHNSGPWTHHAQHRSRALIDTLPHPEVLLTVVVYKPFRKNQQLVFDQEYQLLGQQSLSELRDVIKCKADYVVTGNDFSDNPDLPQDITTKDLFKSGFFFIEGVFYNDMRDSSSWDYSRSIIEWSKTSAVGVGPFESKTMDSVKFFDLSIKLGQPYLYMHQGDCEHLLVFSDLRLLHTEDCQDVSQYPLQSLKVPARRQLCRVCSMHQAKWVTMDSSLAPEDPCFFCDSCFRYLHYDSDGHKLSEFRAYPFPQMPS